MQWNGDPKFNVSPFCRDLLAGNVAGIIGILAKAREVMAGLSAQQEDDPNTPELEDELLALEPFERYVATLPDDDEEKVRIQAHTRRFLETSHSVNRYINSKKYEDAAALSGAYQTFAQILRRVTPGGKRLQADIERVAKNLKVSDYSTSLDVGLPGMLEIILRTFTRCPSDDLIPASNMASAVLLKAERAGGARAMAIKTAAFYHDRPIDPMDMRSLPTFEATQTAPVFTIPTAPKIPGVVFNPGVGTIVPAPGDTRLPSGRERASSRGWGSSSLAPFAIAAVLIFGAIALKRKYDVDLKLASKVYIYGRNSTEPGDYNCTISLVETSKRELPEDVLALSADLSGYAELYGMAFDLAETPHLCVDINSREQLEDGRATQLLDDLRRQMGAELVGGIWTTKRPL
ncbi:hypothetical protein [Lyngbya sp. CCY1209]|uniref:hypothetical protein n=1 Tax=Lyngbya sp. CCY1209 TaxID=2886103 RepID=UPI002D200C1F|nr:hypothetical protein [Lyngbya sp. CCY1209]MEB3884046.1 hypothetical protein [Lyngbya sp. CCY1209]